MASTECGEIKIAGRSKFEEIGDRIEVEWQRDAPPDLEWAETFEMTVVADRQGAAGVGAGWGSRRDRRRCSMVRSNLTHRGGRCRSALSRFPWQMKDAQGHGAELRSDAGVEGRMYSSRPVGPARQRLQQRCFLALMTGHTSQNVVENDHGRIDVRSLVEHDTLGPLAHRGVGNLGPRWLTGSSQLVENLRGPNNRQVGGFTKPEDLLLHLGQAFVPNLYGQVTSGDHHADQR